MPAPLERSRKIRDGTRAAFLAVVAGSGDVVRAAVEAGADEVIALSASVYRKMGRSALASFMPYGDANAQTRALLLEHVLPHVGKVPVIAGVFGDTD